MEIIGEKINTSRKEVAAAVQGRDAAFIQELARKQAEAGADYLDVNSGLALYPEEEAEDFSWLVPTIQEVVETPLCIDSTRPQAIAAALELCRGQSMINSVNGDPESLASILPLAARHGSKVIAIPASREGGIPATSEGRVAIARTIAAEAQRHGVALGSVYFDPLVLSISTNHDNGLLFLQTLTALKQEFPEARTVSGLSNVSFGLPRRGVLNRSFLALALGRGMDAAILDPTDRKLMALARATATLLGEDAHCAGYLRAFREGRLDP
ncbi:MAG TPA: dihydropteroate synthase [Deferrisomatales bacterium]|nr:dihydropteroate synthase [Deferrisomatales bacterium]